MSKCRFNLLEVDSQGPSVGLGNGSRHEHVGQTPDEEAITTDPWGIFEKYDPKGVSLNLLPRKTDTDF